MVLYRFSLHVFKLLIYPTVILFLNSVGTGDNCLSVLKFTEGFSGLMIMRSLQVAPRSNRQTNAMYGLIKRKE